jgi:hypothetical protein
LDAFDESESSVPGTISMLFSILSACLCAWVVSESMTMRSVSFFSCFSLFFLFWCFLCERQTRSSQKSTWDFH